MIWRRRRDATKPTFVEAGPGLFERLAETWHRPGVGGAGRFLRFVGLLLVSPFAVVRALFVAIADAGRSAASTDWEGGGWSRVRNLVFGLPAVLAAIAAVTIAGLAIGHRPALAETYRGAAIRAFGDRPDAARLYYERLFRLDGGAAETRLLLGLTLEKLERDAEAEALIRGVADGDAGGDPRANRWVAGRLLADLETLRDQERLNEAYRHLVKAERGLPRDATVKLDLVKYHLATRQGSKAIPKLAEAATLDPAFNYDLARLYAANGQQESATQAMGRAESHFRRQLDAKPEDRRVRLLLSSCVANLGRLDEAIAILHEGPTHDPQGPYAQSIAKVYVSAYDRLAGQRPPDHPAMIRTLREALKSDPASVEAAVRLADFGEPASGVKGAGTPDLETASQAREMLESLLASGEQPPAVHMALGLKAWRGGETQKASWHFQRAYELDPSLSGVANNLAWTLTQQENPDLERALAIIDPVIERFPGTSHFLDTRGEIYLRMERWEDALRDFERALPQLRNNARLHTSLATVYERLGQKPIAERHRKEAERLAAQSNSVRPEATVIPAAREYDEASVKRP